MALDINSTLLLNLKVKSPPFLKMKNFWEQHEYKSQAD